MRRLHSLTFFLVWLPFLVAATLSSRANQTTQESDRMKSRAQRESACRAGLELAGSENPASALPHLTVCQQSLTQTDATANPLRWELARAFVKLESFTEAASVLETIHDESQEGLRQKLL